MSLISLVMSVSRPFERPVPCDGKKSFVHVSTKVIEKFNDLFRSTLTPKDLEAMLKLIVDQRTPRSREPFLFNARLRENNGALTRCQSDNILARVFFIASSLTLQFPANSLWPCT